MAQNIFSMPGLSWQTPVPQGVTATFGTQKPVNITQAYQSGGLTPMVQQAKPSVLGAETSSGGKNVPAGPSGAAPSPVAPTSSPTPPVPQGPSDEEINSLYNPSLDYLNQAENSLRSDYSNVLSQADKDFQTLTSQLTSNKNANLGIINENEVKAGQVKDDALSAARRLYDELRRGYQQRFGGSTSAGQAATEISNVEQQRQMGQTTRQYGDTVRQIGEQRRKVEDDFNQGLLQLEQNKRAAIAQAQSDFQAKLLEIASNRSQIGQAKAQSRLDALQQLRNQVFQIQQQNFQFQQSLAAQRQQAEMQLASYAQQFSGYGAASGQAVAGSGMNTNPTSGLVTNGGYAASGADMTGAISTRRSNDYDQYGNPRIP